MTTTLRKGIFICYSHRDEQWRQTIETFLRGALYGEEDVQVWSDKQLQAGESWRQEIEAAINSARVGVVLVSADLLASSFIRDVELPRLLDAARTESLVVHWIPVSSSNYERTQLVNLQAASDPARPLDIMPIPEQRAVLAEITRGIVAAVNVNRVGNAFKVADTLTQQLDQLQREESGSGGAGYSGGGVYAVQTLQIGDEISISEHGVTFEQITVADMDKLDDNAQQLIRSWERSMQRSFDRWTEIWPDRVAQDPRLRERALDELRRIKVDLCADLTNILNFVESMGKKLRDHYVHVRYLCSQSAP